ncbi:MAG: pantetheine-phosphate adenylyltransferase [Candidatus Dormiibacterota bacterium]
MGRHALYAGTFDPFTLGHLEIVRRSAAIFGEVTVGVARNPEKRPLFTPEERVTMIGEAIAGLAGAHVVAFAGLTVDFAHANGMTVLVKGLRTAADLDAELQQAVMNAALAPDLETVFLPAAANQLFVSSSILKDVASEGRDVEAFLPAPVALRIKEKFR